MKPNSHALLPSIIACILLAPAGILAQDSDASAANPNKPWQRHTIDDSSRGADGVRLADVNGDGLQDITTGWEEGGITRVYVHPGCDKATARWPAVTVGQTKSVEDAVFCDLDRDGAVDVVSSCEGRTRCMFVHWAPKQWKRYLTPEAWQTEAIPVTQDKTAWMFALPMQIDGRGGPDLVVASKGGDALVGWLQAPADPREMAGWRLHTLYKAGWIMSLAPADVDADGDLDVVVSDRKGNNTGVLWLENPGPKKATGKWAEHRIGASGLQVMFLDVADLDRDGRRDVIVAVKPDEIHWLRCPSDPTDAWPSQVIKVALPEGMGTAKAVRAGDINGDGRPDIVYSCEQAKPPKRGLVWLGYRLSPTEKQWIVHDIGGPVGIKYDRIELLDIDGDGDLDVLTCEEHQNRTGLGVFWHENPLGGDKGSRAGAANSPR